MKSRRFCLNIAAALLAAVAAARAADLPPMFSPEPPDPAAAALVEAYLPLLAEGRFDEALALQDLRGMRQYLLDRRLADLKASNPELTAKDLDDISAKLQVTDLAPARLHQILSEVLQEAGYPGMTWQVRGYAPAPDGIQGWLASIEARTADGKEKPILLGLVKLGDQWRIAPAILEEMMGKRPVVRSGSAAEPPPPVRDLIDTFWGHFQTGQFPDAYADMSATYRANVPLLAFLGQAQSMVDQIGVPASWSIVRGIETEPSVLVVGVTIQGSRVTRPTLMRFRKIGQTWVIEDIQFEMPRPQAAPGAGPAAAPAHRPDLQPDLKPDLGPSIPVAPVPPAAIPAPAAPAAPAGGPIPPVGSQGT